MPPREPRLPSPLEAVLVWLLAFSLIIAVVIAVTAAAGVLAVGEGLKPDVALRLISDPASSPLFTSPSWIAAGIAINELTLLGVVLLWRRRLQLGFSALVPTARPTFRAVLGSVLLPFGLAPLAEVLSELARRGLPEGASPDGMVTAMARGTTTTLLLLVLVGAALLPAVVEELMFRGLITTAFQRYSPLIKLLVPSLMFGLFHVDAGTAALGVAFGLVRLYTGSIGACMLSHLAYNTGVILEARWFVRETEFVAWDRVGLGLALSVVASVLLVGDLGKRFPFMRPPSSRRGP